MTLFRTHSLVCIAAALFFLSSASIASAEMIKIGVVGNVSGAVTATGAEGGARTLEAGSPVYLNDMIVSEAQAKAQIMFLDKSSLMINPNTSITVDKFIFDPATSTGDLSIQNAKGALRFIGGALSKKKPVTIVTPVATIGIRGGIVDTHVALDGATDAVFVFGDELTMANAKGQIQRVTEVGQGLSLLDANSIPMPLSPERAAALSASFSAVGGDSTDKKDNSDGGDTGDKADQAGNGEGKKNNQEADREGNKEGKPKVEAKDKPKADIKPNEGKKPLPLAKTGQATQGNQRSEGVVQYNQREFTPTDAGSYVISRIGDKSVVQTGHANLERHNGRLNGKLIQNHPNTNVEPLLVSLPWLADMGFQQVTTATSGGNGSVGDGFKTNDHAMRFYDLRRDGMRMAMLVGRLAPQSSWANSSAASANFSGNTASGLSFYDFLPDLAGFKPGQQNFFDYNMASELFQFGGGIGNDQLGLVVNWNTDRFITGHLDWDRDSSGIDRGLVLAFGKTQNSGTLLNGHVYEFFNINNRAVSNEGTIHVTEAFSPGNNAAFSGFLLSDNTGNVNPKITQGVVQGEINQHAVASASQSSGGLQRGFAAGFISTKVDDGPATYKRYANTGPGGVSINPDAANGNVSASFSLNNVGEAGKSIEADFGTVSGNTAASAYLTDDLFAATQSRFEDEVDNEFTGNDVAGGVLVAGSLISGAENQCNACQFVNWGVWAGEVDRSVSGIQKIDTANMVPYVAGQVTQNLTSTISSQNLGAVTYNGSMLGSTLQGGDLERHTGTFAAGINLNTRKLTDFDASIAGLNFGFTGQNHGIQGSGDAMFSNVAVHNLSSSTANNLTAGSVINGALFGPNAEDIGGNFAIKTVTGTQATGVYIGTQTD